MKRIDLATSIVLIPIDYVMLVAAGLASYDLRYQGLVARFRPVYFEYPLPDFILPLLAFSLIGIGVFALSGSYKITSTVRLSELLSKVFLGISTTLLIIIVVIFFQREFFSSRFVIIFSWLLAIIFVCTGRLAVFTVKAYLIRLGIGLHHIVVVGTGQVASDLTRHFRENPSGSRVIAHYVDFGTHSESELRRVHSARLIDEMVDTRDALSGAERLDTLNLCEELGISYRYVAPTYESRIVNFDIINVAGYPIVQIYKTPLEGWGRIAKRSVDILAAFFALLLLAPLILVIAIGIRVDSRGPIVIGLKRVGRGGKVFTLYKFRSMVPGAHEMKKRFMNLNERSDGPLFKVKDDPRITKFGKLLRQSSLDELPQLWNVLGGSMSLVGPRPHEPEEVARYEKRYRTLIGAKPGITGLAQVSGRSNLPFDDEVRFDMYYIEKWSLKLDFQVIVRTIIVVLRFKDSS